MVAIISNSNRPNREDPGARHGLEPGMVGRDNFGLTKGCKGPNNDRKSCDKHFISDENVFDGLEEATCDPTPPPSLNASNVYIRSFTAMMVFID